MNEKYVVTNEIGEIIYHAISYDDACNYVHYHENDMFTDWQYLEVTQLF